VNKRLECNEGVTSMIEPISETSFYIDAYLFDLVSMMVKTEMYSGIAIHTIRQPLAKIMNEYELYKRGRKTVDDDTLIGWYLEWKRLIGAL
jgi:hypothetical protein